MNTVETKEFLYGQWNVRIEVKEWLSTSYDYKFYCTIDCTGNWVSTQGIMYDITRQCCAYENPEILPSGLKFKIFRLCKKYLIKYENSNRN